MLGRISAKLKLLLTSRKKNKEVANGKEENIA